MEWSFDLISPLVLLFVLLQKSLVSGLGCYVCTSFNGSDELCEDKFNTVRQESFDFYNERCMGYRKDRHGYFPADHCVKIKGVSNEDKGATNYSIMIRTCSVDSGSMTSDTEIVRISHCGHFTYNGHYFSGCVQSCHSDGCNGAADARPALFAVLSLIVLAVAAV